MMIVAIVGSTARQIVSLVRSVSEVGWTVRAHIQHGHCYTPAGLASLPNVELVEGELTHSDRAVILMRLFSDAKFAFVNTSYWSDEIAVGTACADAAKSAGVQHYVYSSMPDHSTLDTDWTALPLWASKFIVENYVRQLEIPATFTYMGFYYNNFTSLPCPLFQMELQDDGNFVWQAPFDPNEPLPWLDAEHDIGPALLQIFRLHPNYWKGRRCVSCRS